jgi:hypothetical protein
LGKYLLPEPGTITIIQTGAHERAGLLNRPPGRRNYIGNRKSEWINTII